LALHDLEHFVHAASDLIGGLAGHGGPGGDKGEDGGQSEGVQGVHGRGLGNQNASDLASVETFVRPNA